MSFARDFVGDSFEAVAFFTRHCNFSPGLPWGDSPHGDAKWLSPLVLRCWHSCCSRSIDYKLRVPRMSNAVLGLRLKQQLTLTPRLQQSVKLLQLSALECVQELHQAIAQNPFLEESAEQPESSQAEESAADDSSHADLDFSGSGSSGGDDTPDWTEWTASPSTLHDSLREQLLLLGLTERDYMLANLIIDALDEDGFLRQPLAEFANQAPDVQPG